jgi:hypothetical protein
MNIRLHHPRPIERTHCRICEARLTQDDDPVWALCPACLEQSREWWMRVYALPDNEPAATGVIERPNRNA